DAESAAAAAVRVAESAAAAAVRVAESAAAAAVRVAESAAAAAVRVAGSAAAAAVRDAESAALRAALDVGRTGAGRAGGWTRCVAVCIVERILVLARPGAERTLRRAGLAAVAATAWVARSVAWVVAPARRAVVAPEATP
ncbi:MAG TPA: hypothetical protein VF257_03850, partial [Solirubrobacteraceae bacterium]